MASKKRPTAKAVKPPSPAVAAKPKAAPTPAAARKMAARKRPAPKAATAKPAAAAAPAPASTAHHDPKAFDAWSTQHLAAGPTARSRSRSSTGGADEGELDLAALTRPGAVLEVHFADGSTYYAVPADFLRRHVPAPPPLRSGGPARLVLPFDLGGRGAQRSRSAAAASAIEQYAVSELTEPTTLDRLFDVAETFRQTARRWFGIGAGDARTPPLAAKLCAAFENASLHDAVGSGGGALLRWDAGGWVPVGAPLAPKGGKVLLFLHGTASSTAGSFGKLWGAKSSGPVPDDFAPLADSHLLLGWDHRSLTLSPVDNLIGLVEALLAWLPAGCTVDVVSHSRGGLVGELFALRSATPSQLKAAQPLFERLFAEHPDGENLAPMFQRLAEAGAAFAPGRFVRVACPARGTLLADGRTDLFLSLMLRALKLATSGVGELVLGRVTALVKSLVAARADARHLPGLEAMIPGSPLTLALARCEAQPADRLRVIAGDAAARGLSGLLTLVADVFYGWHDHDYVVHTRSMFGGLKRSVHAPLSLRWEHGSVSHFAYFAPEHPSRKALLATLAGQDDRYAPLAEDERRTRGVLQAMKSDPLTRKLDFDHWLAGSNSAEQRRKPVLVVLAGIMGSELKRRSAPKDEPIWLTLGSMIGGKLDELELGRASNDPLVASGLLAVSYERLLERAQQQFSVLVFPFDWRAPIADSGAALAALLGQVEQALAADNRVPVHLLVHSMGGLVARHALYIDAAGRALWSTLKQRDSRLVMLGTPNGGSYSPAQLLLRQHSMSQMLGLLARGVSVGDLSRFGAAFPGLMAMLPQAPDPQFGDLFDTAAWDQLVALDSGTIRPDAATLQAARDYVRGAAFEQSYKELRADPQAFYVAGSGDTALQMRPAPNPWGGFFGDGGGAPVAAIEFMAGPQGDGTVPWEGSVLADARTWYAPCEHGTLPDHTDSFEAYFELLTGGSTRRLPQQPPRKRGEGDAAAALLPLPRPPGPALLPASDAELADYVLQQRVAQPAAAADPDPIEVRVVHGGLDYARYPLIVSHYQHEPLAGAGKRVDEKLHGQLARVLELRLFVGAAMTAHYLRPNSHSAAEPPYRGALVLGLGSIGELTPGSLADTVTRGVLRYAFEHIHRDPYAPGPDQPVELRLSSLLVGVQSPAFTVRDSLGGLLYGMWRAAQLLMRMGGRERPVRIRELEIVEIDEHTALDAAYELQRLLQRGEWTDRLHWKRQVLEQREGAVSGYRPRGNRSSWQRLLARDDGHGGLAFSLIAERARVESTRVRADVQSLLRLIDRVSDGRADPDDPIQSPTDPRFGGVLYQLLLPPELKTRLVNLDNTVLVVDDATACYPWELLSPPLASAADGEEPRPFVVHAGMVRQRDSSEFLSLPVAPSGYHALIVGAPDTRGWRDERGGELQFTDLPGARAEAERVRELLRADERWGRPTELISRPPPADPRARLSRWDAKSSEHVRIALLERPYRLLHLCGHGVVDHWIRNDKDGKPVRKTGMLLSDQEILGAVDVEQMSAVPEFVFINCCYSGRDGGDAAADGGGAGARQRAALAASLALAFIRMGSKAVVAAGWQVDDEAALQFADAFYTRLLGGLPFGDAVRIARAEVHARHGRSSNTWGAYQCYGDPQWQLPGQAVAPDGGTSRLRDACNCMSAGELAARVRQVLAVAGDKPPGEVLRQLDRLVSDLEADPLRRGWLADSQVRAALGMAYRELDDHEKAARHLQTGARTAGSEVQIGQLELLMNSLTRVRGERGTAARAASKRLLELLNGIADDAVARWPLTDGDLPMPAARSERHCLLGGEYLREAVARLEGLEPDDEGRLAPGSKDRGEIATAFERAVVEFVQGYGDKCQERDKAERRSYALSNALLATSLGALFGQPAAALRALGALPGPAAAAAERTSGTPERWLREAQLLMNELTVADDQATFWHQAALLELQLARGLFRNAYTQQPSAEDVAPVRRMIDQVLARWPSPVQLDSLRHRFRLLRFVVLCRAPGQRGGPADAMQGLRLELKKLCDEALDHKLTFPQARSL